MGFEVHPGQGLTPCWPNPRSIPSLASPISTKIWNFKSPRKSSLTSKPKSWSVHFDRPFWYLIFSWKHFTLLFNTKDGIFTPRQFSHFAEKCIHKKLIKTQFWILVKNLWRKIFIPFRSVILWNDDASRLVLINFANVIFSAFIFSFSNSKLERRASNPTLPKKKIKSSSRQSTERFCRDSVFSTLNLQVC